MALVIDAIDIEIANGLTIAGQQVPNASSASTFTNKTIDGSLNTLTNIPQSSVTNLTSDLSAREFLTNKSTAVALGTSDTLYPTQNAVKTYVDSQISSATLGLLNDRGNYDASTNAYPSTGGSGTSGAVMKGNLWTISVAGTLGGTAVTPGDVVRALVNTPGQTSSNWAIGENNFGYVAENSSNKSTDGTLSANSTTLYPSQSAVKTYADTKSAIGDSFFIGTTQIANNRTSASQTLSGVSISGNASTVTTNANLTGPVTSVGNATSVTNNAITNAMLAQAATLTLKGNNTASLGNVVDLTVAQIYSMLGIKAGILANTNFTLSTTYRATITFTTPYANTNYSIQICGGGVGSPNFSRTFTIMNKTTTGFTINTNSATVPPTGTDICSWVTVLSGN